jgi:hypothetical protein
LTLQKKSTPNSRSNRRATAQRDKKFKPIVDEVIANNYH